MKEKILELRRQGKTYDEIKAELGCSKSTISYHCGEGQKEKFRKRNQKNRTKHPFIYKLNNFLTPPKKTKTKTFIHKWKKLLKAKLETFSREYGNMKEYVNPTITIQDVLDKFGENPKCYLTGIEIDIYQPRTYAFDHRVPRSRGGTNTLDNLEICTREANMAKHNMTPEEFIDFCRSVLLHNDYEVKAPATGIQPV